MPLSTSLGGYGRASPSPTLLTFSRPGYALRFDAPLSTERRSSWFGFGLSRSAPVTSPPADIRDILHQFSMNHAAHVQALQAETEATHATLLQEIRDMRAAQARLTARLEAQEADNRDRLHAIEADTAAAQDAAASALRHAAQWPATPANPTLRRDTILGVPYSWSPAAALGGGDTLPPSVAPVLPPRRILQRGALDQDDRAGGRDDGTFQRGEHDRDEPAGGRDVRSPTSPDMAGMGWRPSAIPDADRSRPASPPPPAFRGDEGVPHGSIGKQWLPTGSVKTFSGSFLVGSTCPSTNPMVWARDAREALRDRHIPHERWVATAASCLDSCVKDRFRASRMGDDHSALAARLIGSDAHDDPFRDTSWDDFVRWLMTTYVTADKIEAMELLVGAMSCSSVQGVEKFIIDFNTAAMSSDYMRLMLDAVVPGHQLLDAVKQCLDTAHRRVAFRRAMPAYISRCFTDREANERTSNPHWAFSLASMQALARAQAKAGLAAVERGELRSADVNHIAVLPDVRSLPALPMVDAAPTPPPPSQASETLMLLRSLHSRLDDIQGAPSVAEDGPELYLRLEDLTSSPPPPELIEQRRVSKACLACGEKSSHWKFTECPKLLADPTIKAKIDAALAEARRGRSGPTRQRQARFHMIEANDDASAESS